MYQRNYLPSSTLCYASSIFTSQLEVLLITNQTRQIHFRLSEIEYQKLAKSADNLGMTTSAYAKKIALGKRLVQPTFPHDQAVSINHELKKIGVNLNQLTKRVNTELFFDDQELSSLKNEVRRLWQQLK